VLLDANQVKQFSILLIRSRTSLEKMYKKYIVKGVFGGLSQPRKSHLIPILPTQIVFIRLNGAGRA
jgi:hypothetical protein